MNRIEEIIEEDKNKFDRLIEELRKEFHRLQNQKSQEIMQEGFTYYGYNQDQLLEIIKKIESLEEKINKEIRLGESFIGAMNSMGSISNTDFSQKIVEIEGKIAGLKWVLNLLKQKKVIE